jgi:hypothetical protein
MIRGIFYNSEKAQCSIYESGLMCYNALKQSDNYILDYTEEQVLYVDYDFAVFNQHVAVNNWMTNGILNEYKGKKYCIVLEVGQDDELMPLTPKIFDAYIVIDPSITDHSNVYGFPRPIEYYQTDSYIDRGYPTIGSFGFATDGKRWGEIIELAQQDFDTALVKINIPFATYVTDSWQRTQNIMLDIKSRIKKPGIRVELTHDYMNKEQLVRWCSRNTINYFPYYRNMHGLAAVTDQAISAKRPILVTTNPTFRHLFKYIKPYPNISLKDAIQENYQGVLKMNDDWSPANFCKKFESIIK